MPVGVSERPSLNQCSCGDLPDGDRDEAGQPRLGRQRVVVGAVEPPVGDAVPDREQPPLAVEEEAELHFLDEDRRPAPPGACPVDQFLGFGARLDRRAASRRRAPLELGEACVIQCTSAVRLAIGSAAAPGRRSPPRPGDEPLQVGPPLASAIAARSSQWPRPPAGRLIGRRRVLELVEQHADRRELVVDPFQQRLPGRQRRRALAPARRASRSARARGAAAAGAGTRPRALPRQSAERSRRCRRARAGR